MNDLSKWESISKLLDNSGITDLYDSFSHPGSPWDDLANSWRRLPNKYQHALRMFVGGQEEKMSDLPDQVVTIVKMLKDLGFARIGNDCVDLEGLSLYRYRGCWLLAQRVESSSTLYFGNDSVELASRLSPVCGGKALDLCTGPGVIALIEAASGMSVTSVDVNPLALELQKANTYLNGVSNRVSTVKSNLFEDLPVQQFDLITANPPLLPIPDGIPYPFVGDGGPHGLDITLAILKKATDYLTDSGTLLIIGVTTLNGIEIDQEQSIREALIDSGLEATMTVMQCASAQQKSSWNRSLAMTSMAFVPEKYQSFEAAVDLVDQGYEEMSVDGVCTFILRSRKGDGGLTVLNYGHLYSQSLTWKL